MASARSSLLGAADVSLGSCPLSSSSPTSAAARAISAAFQTSSTDLLYLRVQRKSSRKKVTFDPERIQFSESVEKFWEIDLLLESFKIVLFKTKLNGDSRFSFQVALRSKFRCLGRLPWLPVEVTQSEKYSCLACFVLPGQNGDIVA